MAASALRNGWLAIALLLAAALPALAAPGVSLLEVRGRVLLECQGRQVPARPGLLAYPGDRILVGEGASCALLLPDGTRRGLPGGSLFTVQAPASDGLLGSLGGVLSRTLFGADQPAPRVTAGPRGADECRDFFLLSPVNTGLRGPVRLRWQPRGAVQVSLWEEGQEATLLSRATSAGELEVPASLLRAGRRYRWRVALARDPEMSANRAWFVPVTVPAEVEGRLRELAALPAPQAALQQALLLDALGLREEACSVLEQALRKSPGQAALPAAETSPGQAGQMAAERSATEAALWGLLGELRLGQGLPGPAVEALRQAIRLDSGAASLHNLLGLAYQQLLEDRLFERDRLRLVPGSRADNDLDRDPDRLALRELEAATRLEPERPEFTRNLMLEQLYLRGQSDLPPLSAVRLLSALESCAAASPDRPDDHYLTGLVYLHLLQQREERSPGPFQDAQQVPGDRLEQARAALTRARQLDPAGEGFHLLVPYVYVGAPTSARPMLESIFPEPFSSPGGE